MTITRRPQDQAAPTFDDLRTDLDSLEPDQLRAYYDSLAQSMTPDLMRNLPREVVDSHNKLMTFAGSKLKMLGELPTTPAGLPRDPQQDLQVQRMQVQKNLAALEATPIERLNALSPQQQDQVRQAHRRMKAFLASDIGQPQEALPPPPEGLFGTSGRFGIGPAALDPLARPETGLEHKLAPFAQSGAGMVSGLASVGEGIARNIPLPEQLEPAREPVSQMFRGSAEQLDEISQHNVPEDGQSLDEKFISGFASMGAFAGAGTALAPLFKGAATAAQAMPALQRTADLLIKVGSKNPKLAAIIARSQVTPNAIIESGIQVLGMGGTEALVESGNTYADWKRDHPGDEAGAMRAAGKTFALNMGLIPTTEMLGSVYSPFFKGLGKMRMSFFMEGAQEGFQDVIQATSLQKAVNWPHAAESSLIGGVVGAGTTALDTETWRRDQGPQLPQNLTVPPPVNIPTPPGGGQIPPGVPPPVGAPPAGGGQTIPPPAGPTPGPPTGQPPLGGPPPGAVPPTGGVPAGPEVSPPSGVPPEGPPSPPAPAAPPAPPQMHEFPLGDLLDRLTKLVRPEDLDIAIAELTDQHRRAVTKARDEGLPISDAVKAEYPDLFPPAATAPPVPPETPPEAPGPTAPGPKPGPPPEAPPGAPGEPPTIPPAPVPTEGPAEGGLPVPAGGPPTVVVDDTGLEDIFGPAEQKPPEAPAPKPPEKPAAPAAEGVPSEQEIKDLFDQAAGTPKPVAPPTEEEALKLQQDIKDAMALPDGPEKDRLLEELDKKQNELARRAGLEQPITGPPLAEERLAAPQPEAVAPVSDKPLITFTPREEPDIQGPPPVTNVPDDTPHEITEVLPPERFPVARVDPNSIKVDADTFQFKQHSDETGVVKKLDAEEWDPFAAGMLLVYENKEGERFVANGHHRLDLAKRLKVPSVNVQILKESDGYTPTDARRIAAETNIKEGRGTVLDHAEFFRTQPEYSEEKATKQRIAGQGFKIARLAGEHLYNTFRSGEITPEHTTAILDAAGKDEDLQDIGLRSYKENPTNPPTPQTLTNFLNAVKAAPPAQSTGPKQGVLFGGEEWEDLKRRADAMAGRATKIQKEIRDRKNSITGLVQSADRVKKAGAMGLPVTQEQADEARKNLQKVLELDDRFSRWNQYPDLVDAVNRLGEKPSFDEKEADRVGRIVDELLGAIKIKPEPKAPGLFEPKKPPEPPAEQPPVVKPEPKPPTPPAGEPKNLERALAIEKNHGLSAAEAAVINSALDKIPGSNYTTEAEALQKESIRIAVKAGVSLAKVGDLKTVKRILEDYPEIRIKPAVEAQEFNVGDTVHWVSRHTGNVTVGNYRGRVGDKAVIVTEKGSQVSVPYEDLRAPSALSDQLENQFNQAFNELVRSSDTGYVKIRDLRSKLSQVDPSVFDDLLVNLSKQFKYALHPHHLPKSLSAEEQAGLLTYKPTGQQFYYVSKAKPGSSEQKEAPEAPPPKSQEFGSKLIIQRGQNGPVNVQFPDRNHADLYSLPGRLRRQVKQDFKGLSHRLGMTEKELNEASIAYFEKVMADIKGLKQGETYNAPRFDRNSLTSAKPKADNAQQGEKPNERPVTGGQPVQELGNVPPAGGILAGSPGPAPAGGKAYEQGAVPNVPGKPGGAVDRGLPAGTGRSETIAQQGVEPGKPGGAVPGPRGQPGNVGSRPGGVQQQPGGTAVGGPERRGLASEAGAERQPQEPAAGSKPGGVGVQHPAGGTRVESSKIPSEKELEDLFNQALAGSKPSQSAPGPAPEQQPDQKSASEKIADAKDQFVSGMGEVNKGLNDLFSLNKPGVLRMGPAFDEETYRKARPHFNKAYRQFRAAGRNIMEAIGDVFNYVIQKWGEKIRDYAMKWALFQREAELRRLVAPTAEGEYQIEYKPYSKAPTLNTLIPIRMQESVTAALKKLEESVGDIDQFVADELDLWDSVEDMWEVLGAEQVDAAALAISNLQQQAGFIIGDQTGVGKGRFVAAMLWWAHKKGHFPVFITRDAALYEDMIRDLHAIGVPLEVLGDQGGLKILTTNNKFGERQTISLEGVKEGAKLKVVQPILLSRALNEMNHGRRPNFDLAFTTYYQLQYRSQQPTARHLALAGLAPQSMYVLDESHEAGGTGAPPIDPQTGEPIPSRASFVRSLLAMARGVVYSSATYAKRANVMSLYNKTDLGLLQRVGVNLEELFEKGGVPMQQIVSNMLIRAGQFIRREKSFAGIDMGLKTVEVDKTEPENACASIRDIFAFDQQFNAVKHSYEKDLLAEHPEIVIDKKKKVKSAMTVTPFSAVLHNIVQQMLLSIKAEQSADRAIEAWRGGIDENGNAIPGKKPVIALSNTMGAFLNQFTNALGFAVGDNIGKFTFNKLLERYLENCSRVTIRDSTGQKHRVFITDAMLASKHPHLLQLKRNVARAISDKTFERISVSPIDVIRQRMEAAGMRVGEITGRGTTVEFQSDGTAVLQARKHSPNDKKETMNAFNRGTLDALIINRSGSTGFSLHSDKGYGDTRPRHMIVTQADTNVDTFIQILGRINRTNQAVLPSYEILSSDLPAENRPNNVLLKKMASLNANTTANRASNFTLKEVTDFFNKYGDKVVSNYLENDARGLAKMLGVDPLDIEDLAQRATGRLAILTQDVQQAFWDTVEARYKEMIETLDALGQNTLEAKVLRLDAVPIDNEPLTRNMGNSPFLEASQAETMDVRLSGKPFTSDQVWEKLRSFITRYLKDNEVFKPSDIVAQGFEATQNRLNVLKAAYSEMIAAKRATKTGKTPAQQQQIENEISRMNNAKDKVGAFFQNVYIGKPVKLTERVLNEQGKFDPGEIVDGVILNIVGNPELANPMALGSVSVQIALCSPARQVTVSLSTLDHHTLLDPGATADASRSHTINTLLVTLDRMLEDFEQSQHEARERRVMITGNLVMGFHAMKHRGQITFYEDENGEIKQGILMPRGTTVDQATSGAPYLFSDVNHVMRFIQAMGKDAWIIKSSDGSLDVTRTSGGYPVLRAPKESNLAPQIILGNKYGELKWTKNKAGDYQMVLPSTEALAEILKIVNEKVGTNFYTNTNKKVAEQTQTEIKAMLARLGGERGAIGERTIPAAVNIRIDKAVRDALKMKEWKDWYERHEPIIDEMFGIHDPKDIELFKKILAATSAHTSVAANVRIALEEFWHIKRRGRPKTKFEAHRQNLDRLILGEKLHGPKVSEMEKAMLGDPDAIVVDTHMIRYYYGDVRPNLSMIEGIKVAVRRAAAKLGWTGRETQAAIWAKSLVDQGLDAEEVTDYEQELTKRADEIESFFRKLLSRSDHNRGKGEGVQAGRTTVRRAEERRAAEANDPKLNKTILPEINPYMTVSVGLPAPHLLAPVSQAELRATFDSITGKWPVSLRIRTHWADTFNDLPDLIKLALLTGPYSSNIQGIKALHCNGESWVIGAHQDNLDDLEISLYHETYGHAGLHLLYGADTRAKMLELAKAIGEKRLVEISKEYGTAIGHYGRALAGAPSGDINAILTEELIAHIAGITKEPDWKQRAKEILGAIREWLRDLGFVRLPNFNDMDLALALRDARRAARGELPSDRILKLQLRNAQGQFAATVQVNPWKGIDEEIKKIMERAGLITLPTEPPPMVFPDGFGVVDEGWKARWLREIQDDLYRLKMVQESIIKARRRPISADADAYAEAALWMGRAEDRLMEFKRKFLKPLEAVVKDTGLSWRDIHVFLYAKHAPERNERIRQINPKMPDGGSGVTDLKAATILSDFDQRGMTADLERVAAIVWGINKERVRILRDAGLENDAVLDAWEKYEYYVPLRGTDEHFEDAAEDQMRIGKRFDIRGTESKRALGRYTRAADMVPYSILQVEESIIRAEKNKVGKAFLELVRQNPNPKFWEINKKVYHATWDARKQEVVYRPDTGAKWADNVLSVKEDGKHTLITLHDKYNLLGRAMKNLGAEQASAIIEAMSSINRYYAKINTTLSPLFTLGNLSRDTWTAFINMAGEKSIGDAFASLKSVPHAMKGIYRVERDHAASGYWEDRYKQFKASGAKVAFLQLEGIEAKRHNLWLMLEAAQGNKWAMTREQVTKVFDFIGDVNSIFENGTRLAAFDQRLKAGDSERDAAVYAKNITVNFNRKGEQGHVISALWLFANAGIQGVYRLRQAMKNPGVQKIAAAIIASSFAISELNRFLGGVDDDDEWMWNKFTDYERERNLMLLMPGGKVALKIPLPYGYNIFHSIGFSISNLIHGEDLAKETARFGSSVYDSFNPLGGGTLLQTITPTVFDPIVELATNKNFFGAPIRPDQPAFGAKKPPSQLYWPSVNPVSREVTEKINELTGGTPAIPGGVSVSPEDVDHIVRNLTGGLGQSLGMTMELIQKAATYPEDIQARRVPFLRTFVTTPAQNVDAIEYRKNLGELRQVWEEEKRLREMQDDAGLTRFNSSNLKLVLLARRGEQLERSFASMRRQIDAIQKSDATPAEKRQRETQTRDRINEMQQAFNRDVKRARQ